MGNALDRLRERKKPAENIVPVCMDSGLVEHRDQISARLSQLRNRLGSRSDTKLELEIQGLEDDLDNAQQAVLEASEWFAVRALAPDDYQKLVDAHPPTKEQKQQARKDNGPRASLAWDPDTFPYALMIASVFVLTVKEFNEDSKPEFDGTEDQFTEEFVTEMRSNGNWGGGELAVLVNTAIKINESASNIGAAGNA